MRFSYDCAYMVLHYLLMCGFDQSFKIYLKGYLNVP